MPTDDWIPFSIVLKRILEPQGYVLKRIVGDFRYFDPPAGSSLPRLGFPVRNTKVSKDYVEKILEIIREGEERRGSD